MCARYIWTRYFTGRSVTITVDEPAVKGNLPRWLAAFGASVLIASHGPPGGRTTEHGPEAPLQIELSMDGVVATVTATGELDITTATILTERLLAVAAWHPERLVLDLCGLVFVDVAGARALDDVHTLLQTVCPVILRQPRPAVVRVFGITGLLKA